MTLSKVSLVVASLLVFAACTSQEPTVAPESSAEKPAAEKATVYKIGAIQSLSGDAAGYGDPQAKAMQIAVDEVNAAGGVDGVMLELVAEDSKCDPKTGVTALQKLISVDNVQVVIGGTCSGESLAMAPIANQNKVVLFSASATSPDLTEQGGEFFFRNAPSDTKAGSALAARATAMGLKRMALISENTPFAQGIRNVFKTTYTAGEIVADEVYNTGDADFRSQLTRIKDLAPDGLIVNPQTGASGGLIAKQARELGITVQKFTNETMGGDEGVKSGGLEAMNGIIFHQEVLDDSNVRTKAFVDAYTAKYGERPQYDMYAAGAYDAVKLVVNGIKANGYTGEGIRKYLNEAGTYEGALSTYSFDSFGDSTTDIAPRMIDETGKNVPYQG